MLSDPTERYRRNSDDVIGLSKVVFALIFLSLVAVTIWFIIIGVPGPLLATVPLVLDTLRIPKKKLMKSHRW